MQKPSVAVKKNGQSSHINIYVAGINPSQLDEFLAALKGYAKENSLEFDDGFGLYQFTNTPVLDYAALQTDVEEIFQKIVGDADRPVVKGWYHLRIDTDVDGCNAIKLGSKCQCHVYFDTDNQTLVAAINAIRKALGEINLPGFEVTRCTEEGTDVYHTALYNPLQSKRHTEAVAVIHRECKKVGLEFIC